MNAHYTLAASLIACAIVATFVFIGYTVRRNGRA